MSRLSTQASGLRWPSWEHQEEKDDATTMPRETRGSVIIRSFQLALTWTYNFPEFTPALVVGYGPFKPYERRENRVSGGEAPLVEGMHGTVSP